MIGWLLDTNVIAEIISPGGSTRVKTWAAEQDEASFYSSVLTIGEYEKGIANLPDDEPRRPTFMTLRDSLLARFGERLLPVSDPVVRRWGAISGLCRRATGHPPPATRHRHPPGRDRDRTRPLSCHAQHTRRQRIRRGSVQPLGGTTPPGHPCCRGSEPGASRIR